MKSVFEDLRQPEYVHVLLNHLPLAGLLAALLGLLWSLAARNRKAVFAGLALVGVFALSAWPVSSFGKKAYDRVYSMADDRGDAYLKRHRELAERWIWVYYMTAAGAAAGLVAGKRYPSSLVPIAFAVALMAAGSLAAGATIAYFGGQVRHPEFRNGPPPGG